MQPLYNISAALTLPHIAASICTKCQKYLIVLIRECHQGVQVGDNIGYQEDLEKIEKIEKLKLHSN